MEWIDKKQQRPEQGQIVLACGDGKYPSMCRYNNGKFLRHIELTEEDRVITIWYDKITHWMPLPSPPK